MVVLISGIHEQSCECLHLIMHPEKLFWLVENQLVRLVERAFYLKMYSSLPEIALERQIVAYLVFSDMTKDNLIVANKMPAGGGSYGPPRLAASKSICVRVFFFVR